MTIFNVRTVGHSAVLGSLLFCWATFVGCTGKVSSTAPETPATSAKRVLNLAIWGNYFDEGEQKRFTQTTGIKLNITNYASNEELLAKIQAGASGIDVAVPSDYMVGIMIKMNMLEPLNKSSLSNMGELDSKFLKQPYDPENTYSLPYAWTTTGIAIQKDLFKGQVKSWKDILSDKAFNGRLSMLDDARETMAVAAKINGLTVNTTDAKDLDKIKATLFEARKKIKMFRSDTVDVLANKEVAAAHAYSGDALKAWKKTGGKVEYFLPAEGGTWAIDNVVVLKGAKNNNEAHELINFFMQPETNVAFVKSMLAGPVLTKTRNMLPEDLKNLPGLFPSPEKFSKLERIQDLGEKTREYDKIWTEVKSH